MTYRLHKHLTLLIFLVIKEKYRQYILYEINSTSILFLRSLSHQLVFCLILGNKICLRSSSSSRWSFNISAKDKVNQKAHYDYNSLKYILILHHSTYFIAEFQAIKTSLSDQSRRNKMATDRYLRIIWVGDIFFYYKKN